jgi:hypothetical protein
LGDPPNLHTAHYCTIYERFLFDPRLNCTAKVLLAALSHYGRKDRPAFPSLATLARDLDCSEKTVKRAIADLVKVGAVTVRHEARPLGGHPIPHYYVWPLQPVENQVDKSVLSPDQSDKSVQPSGQICPEQGAFSSYREIDPVEAPSREPVEKPPPLVPRDKGTTNHEQAETLTRLAYEQTPAPLFNRRKVFGIIRSVLDAGFAYSNVERAILQGVGAWTENSLRFAADKANPKRTVASRNDTGYLMSRIKEDLDA